MMRCFLALEVPQEIRERLAALQEKAKNLGLHATYPTTGQLHVTLAFLGEKTARQTEEIMENLKAIKSRKFRLAVRGGGFFPGDEFIRVFWAGAASPADELQRLHEEACKLSAAKPENNFIGHITLARIKGKDNAEALKKLKREIENEVFGEFEVDGVVLMESQLSPAGPSYNEIARINLAHPAPTK